MKIGISVPRAGSKIGLWFNEMCQCFCILDRIAQSTIWKRGTSAKNARRARRESEKSKKHRLTRLPKMELRQWGRCERWKRIWEFCGAAVHGRCFLVSRNPYDSFNEVVLHNSQAAILVIIDKEAF